MADSRADRDVWALATYEILAEDSQFRPIDLFVPNEANIPDVQLEGICDYIFANVGTLRKASN